MKNKTILYVGVTLLVLPFLGIYSFVKTTIYVLIGIYFISFYYMKNKNNENKEVLKKETKEKISEITVEKEPKLRQRIKV